MQRKGGRKHYKLTKQKDPKIDLPGILKSDFSTAWLIMIYNQLILVLPRQVFDCLC